MWSQGVSHVGGYQVKKVKITPPPFWSIICFYFSTARNCGHKLGCTRLYWKWDITVYEQVRDFFHQQYLLENLTLILPPGPFYRFLLSFRRGPTSRTIYGSTSPDLQASHRAKLLKDKRLFFGCEGWVVARIQKTKKIHCWNLTFFSFAFLNDWFCGDFSYS